MKQLMMILPVVLLLLAESRKEKPAPIPVAGSTILVKKFTTMQSGNIVNSITYEYDASGRRKKSTLLNGDYMIITYQVNAILLESFSKKGEIQASYTYHLTKNGQADYIRNNLFPQVVTFQTFNANNNLVAEITKTKGFVTSENYHIYNAAGNKIKDSIPGPTGPTITNYEYYSAFSTIENVNYGCVESGFSNKNSVKKMISLSPISTNVFYYSNPQKDEWGRVVAQAYRIGNNTTEYSYTYY